MESRIHGGQNPRHDPSEDRMSQDLNICFKDFEQSFRQQRISKSKTSAQTLSKEHPKLHVGIIGAGIAGLRCAQVLLDYNVEVTVIEARNRLGGRAAQTTVAGYSVDIGPSWIHGSKNNPILQIAEELGSKLAIINEDCCVYDSGGMLIDQRRILGNYDIIWEILAEACKYSSDHCSTIPPTMNLRDYFETKLSTNSMSQRDRDLIIELLEMWGGFIGDPFQKQSLKWLWLEECLSGENLFLANTHSDIVNHLIESVISRGQLLLSTALRAVCSKQESRLDKKVTVETTRGKFCFDEIIVTVPLGCLMNNTIQFRPELPTSISRAISEASYSRLERVFIAFKMPFWEGPNLTHASHIDQSEMATSSYPIFTQFLKPDYVPPQQQSWTLEMMTLSSPTSFASQAKPILLFSLWGDAAVQMTSAVRELAPHTEPYCETLDRLFRPFYSLLPNYREGNTNCTPIDFHATQWMNDEFAGNGSYTNFKVPAQSYDEGVRAMREGIPGQGVWFAGEHTAPFVALGTSTGAFWSGEAAAVKILRAHDVVEGHHNDP